MDYEIKEIEASKTLAIRHTVMYPNKPLTYVQLPNDAEGTHFGLFLNHQLTTIVSIFINNNEVQFRKLATLHEFQGKGYGSKLLTYIINLAKQEKRKRIWCNARVNKSSFYHKFGFKETSSRFTKGDIDFVIMEKWF